MSLFGNLTNEGLEKTEDRLGGFVVHDSDIYEATITMAYALESTGGAKGVAYSFDLGGGRTYRETIYVTSGRDKGQKNYFERDDKKVPLPGFVIADDIAQCTVGKALAELTFEEKVVNVYDPDAKKEVPTNVQVATELLGQKVGLAILKQLENKNEKTGNGAYAPTAATRETNNIDKVFNLPSKMTTVEAREGLTEARFYDAWLTRNKGQVRDRREIKDGQAGAPKGGAAAAPSAGGAPKKSLFGS